MRLATTRFHQFLDLERDLESAFEVPGGTEAGARASGVFPPVNVYRDREGYLVRMDVPGVPAGDLSVEASGRTLTIAGKRSPRGAAGERQHRVERWIGEFSRSLQLADDADPSSIEASCRNGVLRIRTRPVEAAKPRQISITTAD